MSLEKKPEIIVFAGPNGSGKSTVTKLSKVIEPYINADDIKKANICTDLDAAVIAESLREESLNKGIGFTFETVLSTRRNIELLKRAKNNNYFIRCIYVLTSDVNINVARVESRFMNGGHSVPEEKIRSRYIRAISLIPELITLCDVIHIYDNTETPFRIFKKRKDNFFFWENHYWNFSQIEQLTGVNKW